MLAAANGVVDGVLLPRLERDRPADRAARMLQAANALLRLGLNATLIVGAAHRRRARRGDEPGRWRSLVDAATYGAGAVLIGLMRLPRGLRMEGSHVAGELGEGWREFRSRTWLWAIVLQFAVVNAAIVGASRSSGRRSRSSRWAAPRLGPRPHRAGGRARARRAAAAPRRPRRLLLVATLGDAPRDARDAGSCGAAHARGRLRLRRPRGDRDRDLRGQLGHRDAAGDTRREALARLLLRCASARRS